ncbi:hypothetical protein lbkm_0836 [Lachnospiraceae bacterium KM106-2]|nr:hypothetical protein lbkm_0836 [Lachnospiraceae bacterium KM106-2]
MKKVFKRIDGKRVMLASALMMLLTFLLPCFSYYQTEENTILLGFPFPFYKIHVSNAGIGHSTFFWITGFIENVVIMYLVVAMIQKIYQYFQKNIVHDN